MAYVPVPKDLNAVKTKVMFNLTKRQILCFGGGALIGVPLFFLLKGHIGSSAAALCMMLVMLPLSIKKSGTPIAAPPPKHMSCLFVRLNMTLVFTAFKSLGTGT